MNTILAWIGGVALILGVGVWTGAEWSAKKYQQQIADGKAAFARHIGAANAQTRATSARLAGQLQQSEAKIDDLGQKYRELQSKLTENSCPLSDDDVRSLWNGGSGNPRAKPSNQRRVRHPAGQAAAP